MEFLQWAFTFVLAMAISALTIVQAEPGGNTEPLVNVPPIAEI
ncbi:hypothetical protein X975_01868, partial [Stegodyphus mimosarum]